MANQWYAKVMGEEIGPMTGGQLKQLAAKKHLSPEDLIRKGESGNWTSADRVKGLFDVKIVRPKEIVRPPSHIAVVVERSIHEESSPEPPRLTACPDCDRQVSLQAATCPQCGRQMKEEIHYEQRSRGLAVALAWLIGMTGAHRHYMGESNGGLYLLGTIFLIGIPFVALASILDGFRYLNAEDAYFKVVPRGDHSAGSHRRTRSDTAGNSSGSWVRKLGFLIVIVVGAFMLMNIVDSTERSSETLPAYPQDSKTQSTFNINRPQTFGLSESERKQLYCQFMLIENTYPTDLASMAQYKQLECSKLGVTVPYDDVDVAIVVEAMKKDWPTDFQNRRYEPSNR